MIGSRVRGVLWVLPALLLLALFYILPIGYAAKLSLYDVGYFADRWVGLENYRNLLDEPEFWGSVRVTAKFVIVQLFSAIVVSYAVALGLYQRSERFCMAMLSLYHVPALVGGVVTVTFWRWFYSSPDGPLNAVLRIIGLPARPWLGTTGTAAWAIALSMIVGCSAGALLYVAALGQVDKEIIDAARMDGAGELRIIWSILTPLTNRVRLYIFMVTLIGAMQIWENPYFFTGGGPLGSTKTVMFRIWDKAFGASDFGSASAMTTVGVGFISVLAVLLVRQLRGQIAD